MELDKYQQEAVWCEDRFIRLLAGAGTGKTRALIARILYLMHKRGVPGYEILAVTFSRKAAIEMRERLKGENGVDVLTLHALGLRILKSAYPEWGVADEGDKRRLVRKALKFSQSLMRFGQAPSMLSKAKREVAELDHRGLITSYDQLRCEAHLFDFDDMLVEADYLLQNAAYRKRWQNWSHILVDETQDTDNLQWNMIQKLVGPHTNLFVVGDVSQCHPPGVMICTGIGRQGKAWLRGEKLIEELDSGDTVCGWNRQAQKLIHGRKIERTSRLYEGQMLRVEVGDRRTFVTPNHELLVRWNLELAKTVCVTYLMWRRGFGFRVGWCQLLTKHGNGFHLAQRARLEKADAAWILQVHETRAEASTMESVVAARFGLPTITFEPVHGAQYLTAWNIRAIFEALSDKNFTRGQECLAVYGRLFEHPIYHRTKDYHRWTYFQIAAANLEPRLMKLPLADGVNKWAVVTGLESLPYRGEVFSLDVEKDHLYSADGIVVHNSIYGWRGALPYEMLEGIDYRFGSFTELQLPCNYRSVAVVVELANALVEGKRGGLSLQQVRTDHGAMEWLQFDSGGDEARGVLAAIQADKVDRRYAKWQDYAILYRTNATSERFENILIKNNIPYEIVGNWSFYARAEIKDVLAYLRLSMGWDEESADRVFNKPGRYLGAAWRAELERQGGWKAVEAGKSFHFSRGYMHQRFDEFVQAVLGIQRLNAQGANVLELVDYVLYTIGYKQWLQGEQPDAEDEVKGENLEMLREAVADARSLSSVIDMANRAQRQRQPRGSEDRGVQLLTVHRAKGLEWPVVFVVGCNQAVMPHVHGEPEEEHRIFYVAVTRARDRLVVTSNGMASQFRWFVDPEGVEGDLDEEPGYVRVNGCDEADEAAAGWDEDSWGEISEGPSERKSGEEDDSDGSADDRHGSARHLQ